MQRIDLKHQYGPVALVTGASSGIGQAFAELLAARGLDLVLVARRLERLTALAARLQETCGIQVTICPIDLSDTTAARKILEATATLDVGLVISNAGFGIKGEYTQVEAGVMTDMLNVNCHSPMQLTHGFIDRLRHRGKGGIILTSSVEGLMGCPYSSAYSATKGFVINLGEGLWAELRDDNIDVLTLCPGATDTEAPALQGIDPKTLQHLMSPADVARLAFENIQNGPVYIPSEHYQKTFDRLLSLPRRDALMAMAKSMKPTG
ncbi:SDR family NAD(P)-dependent oxidoreductase [Aestuariicella hydrocarbonica]|uniref:SDR family NAD(P)-dependent oxidoreductase n=1 Tax=Pseudomaricurvus hydrocarbonicus TaxID=1470433 RepID=A0A9E5K0B2_9GAMM|nr:SDR family NAD(P)-dependent oxidoreductase [Aestuariicella hydrocarbonica]NHO66152.1 SDR family NAD(P)-dependent oxidoreductase [Aestuariicella hydrocarbonica]